MIMAEPTQRSFSVPEVAKILGVSDRTVYNMLGEGKLPHVKAGRSYIVTRTHLAEYAGSEDVADDLISTWERKRAQEEQP